MNIVLIHLLESARRTDSALRAAVLLLAVLAAPAAGVVSFDAGLSSGAIFSADGYHVARLENGEREDRWLVDGRVRARGAAGTFPNAAVLSADGGALLHLVAVFDKSGNSLGVCAALNGRRVGAAYAEIQSLTLSLGGRNAAYAAKTPDGWTVVSGQGVGPAFPESPVLLAVADAETLYFERWDGALWLYRDHKPVRRVDGQAVPVNAGDSGSSLSTDGGRVDGRKISVSPDLRHVGVVVGDGARGMYVEVDDNRYGPYTNVSVPAFSRNGRHWASLAAQPGTGPRGYNMIVADGRPEAAASCSQCSLLVDDAGRAFQDVVSAAIGDFKMNKFYLHGLRLSGKDGGGGPQSVVGLRAGGRHFVYTMLTPRGVAVGYDGREFENGVPLPLPNAPVEFDGDGEYHFWSLEGASLRLVCGTVDGSDPKLTRCAQWARSVFTPAE
ncbi:MAG: hypothetical protein ACHQ49_14755 [Elusimicrobiota bacterium]